MVPAARVALRNFASRCTFGWARLMARRGEHLDCVWVGWRSLLAIVVLPVVLVVLNPTPARADYWAPQPVSGSGGFLALASFAGVSCSSASQCVAVGTAPWGTGGAFASASAWFGSTWTPVMPVAPPPTSSTFTVLDGVSCTSGAFCTAVGGYETNGSSDSQTAWAVNWNGSAWTNETTPSLGLPSALHGISCTSAPTCMAVGWQGNQALAEAWDGANWIVEPTPSLTEEASLSAVSCASASSCMAVGETGTPSSGSFSPLAEWWDGSSWTVVPVQLPAGAQRASLEGVSCSAPTTCMAVGYYDGSGGDETPFAAGWSGRTFVVEPPALPSGWPYSSLSGVSCRAANWCLAVGGASNQSYGTETLAERWDGANWTIEPTPNPDQDPEVTILNYLNSVSCVSLGQCEAVGGAGGTNQWLAEQRSESTPVVSAVSPRKGATPGGTLVTVTGVNLTGTTSVRFGRVDAKSFTIQSPEEITAVAPGEPAGTVDITAATPNATSATSPAAQFIFQGLRRNLRLSGVRLSHRRFRTSKGSSTRTAVGTQLRFELSIAANLRIQVAQLRPGARRGRKCVPLHGELKRGRARSCTRLFIIATVKRKRESHGWHRLSFSGEIRRHPLAPGHYRMLIVASAPSQNTMRAQLPFSIVR